MADEISVELGCGKSYVVASADDTTARVVCRVRADEDNDCNVILNKGDSEDSTGWKRVRNGELLPGDGRLFHVKLRANSDLIVHCSKPGEETPEPSCSFTVAFSL